MKNSRHHRLWRRTIGAFAVWFAVVMALDVVEANCLLQVAFFFGGLIVVGVVFRGSLRVVCASVPESEVFDGAPERDFHKEMSDAIEHDWRYSPAYRHLAGNSHHAEYEREEANKVWEH